MKKLILGMILGLLMGYTAVGVTGLVNKPFTFTPLTPAKSAEVNQNFDTIYNEFNGNITNANISSGAAISYSKLNLTGSIINSDIHPNAAIAGSKLNLVGKITAPDFAFGILLPAGSVSVVGTARQILCGTGLSGCGDLSSDRTLAVVDNTTNQKVFWSDGTNLFLRRWGAFLPTGEIIPQVVDDPALDKANVIFSINGGSISKGKLKTDIGSASSGGGALNVTMNDYSFMPSVTTTGASAAIGSFSGTGDPGDTIGRIQVSTDTIVRWRYVTASRPPELVVVHDTTTGEILGVWYSQIDYPDEPPIVALNNPNAETIYIADFPDSLRNVEAKTIMDKLKNQQLNLDCSKNQQQLKSRADSKGRVIYKGAKLCGVV